MFGEDIKKLWSSSKIQIYSKKTELKSLVENEINEQVRKHRHVEEILRQNQCQGELVEILVKCYEDD
uniref:Uncharacterized protein n=1 Tax=Panagrolaimus sp. ES5 TaxID=591445 RepID=A0AC34FUF0_9BILA